MSTLTFPVHIPINTTAEVHFLFVSPAVFCASQAYISGVIAAIHETFIMISILSSSWIHAKDGTYQIVSEQQDTFISSVNSKHNHNTNNCRYCSEGDDEAFCLQLCRKPTCTQCSNKLDHSEGHVEQDGFEVTISKVFDD